MRTTQQISKWIVGLLFIFSGLIKANDPLGLAYKMQEFFEVWTTHLNPGAALTGLYSFGHNHALVLSIIMITAEVSAGAALLSGWRPKPVLWFLFLLTTFFTFLTAYAYASGRFKSCGCFGDCLPLTPLVSLLKDILLTALILFLLIAVYRNKDEVVNNERGIVWVLLAVAGTLVLQWYVLKYLPLLDCLPYKKGASITKGLQPPPGAVPDSFDLQFVYKKEGKEYQFTPASLPNDIQNYEFVERKQVLIRKGNAEPPIKGFALQGLSGTDSTAAILAMPKALIIFAETWGDNNAVMNKMAELLSQAKSKNVFAGIATADVGAAQMLLQKNNLQWVPVFAVDNTAIRTAARANPVALFLQEGMIVEKASAPDFKFIQQRLK